jgi:hypothetical protein
MKHKIYHLSKMLILTSSEMLILTSSEMLILTSSGGTAWLARASVCFMVQLVIAVRCPSYQTLDALATHPHFRPAQRTDAGTRQRSHLWLAPRLAAAVPDKQLPQPAAPPSCGLARASCPAPYTAAQPAPCRTQLPLHLHRGDAHPGQPCHAALQARSSASARPRLSLPCSR